MNSKPYSKNKFCGTITKIFDKREGTGSKGPWELVAFSVKGRFYRTFQLWHDVDSFIYNFREGDEVIITANEVPFKGKDKAGNDVWTYKYNVENIELANPDLVYQTNPMPQRQTEPFNPYQQQYQQSQEQSVYKAENTDYEFPDYEFPDEDLPF